MADQIPVVNLSAPFRSQAEKLLASDDYIYWLDDTHWNREGIRTAAEIIAATSPVRSCNCR